jgi:hypothetical protein
MLEEHQLRKANQMTTKRIIKKQMLKDPVNKLAELLAREPELSAKLAEALATERFLVTVSFQKKYKPDDKHDLHHYWNQRGYPKNDIVASLRQLASDYIAKEDPTRQLPEGTGFH